MLCLKCDQTCKLGRQLAIQALEYSPRPSALGCARGPEWPVMPQRPCQLVYIVLR